MAQFGNKVKLAVLKGMEAIGQGASNLASNAQQRLQELNLDVKEAPSAAETEDASAAPLEEGETGDNA